MQTRAHRIFRGYPQPYVSIKFHSTLWGSDSKWVIIYHVARRYICNVIDRDTGKHKYLYQDINISYIYIPIVYILYYIKKKLLRVL